jgi:hypothetical protein
MSLSGDGTTAVLGSINDTNSNGDRAGSAYVFSSVDGSWDQSTKLLPEDGDDTDFFGEQIDLSTDGTTAIVGNSLDDPTKKDAGSVYVFTKTGGSWNQSAKLTASDGEREDLLGISTALSDDGTTVVAGADGDDTQRGKDVGSAYVFSRRAEIVNLSLQPSKVGGNNSTTHTLSFALRKISADGSTDEFEISFPESVVLKSFSNLSINTSVWSVEQQDNALRFSVNPKGGGVVRIEVTLDVKLTAAE